MKISQPAKSERAENVQFSYGLSYENLADSHHVRSHFNLTKQTSEIQSKSGCPASPELKYFSCFFIVDVAKK